MNSLLNTPDAVLPLPYPKLMIHPQSKNIVLWSDTANGIYVHTHAESRYNVGDSRKHAVGFIDYAGTITLSN